MSKPVFALNKGDQVVGIARDLKGAKLLAKQTCPEIQGAWHNTRWGTWAMPGLTITREEWSGVRQRLSGVRRVASPAKSRKVAHNRSQGRAGAL